MQNRQKIWLRLDNAAKIFPASMRPGWSNVFRLSADLKEKVDPEVLKRAVDRIAPRFPSVFSRLGQGFFWYYLEESTSPDIVEEKSHPLRLMTKREMRRCALRILYYENRIAVEFFHALTDGTGGSIFLKTLLCAYVEEKYGVQIPKECGILDPSKEPSREELEDAFLRYATPLGEKRSVSPAFSLQGKPEKDGYINVTGCAIPLQDALRKAKEYKVSLTCLLSAALVYTLCQIQREKCAPNRERAVRVQIPANLRKPFPSKTLRNFVSVVNVGVEKGECDASFEEILSGVHHQMGLMLTPRHLNRIFSENVNSEKGIVIRLVPRVIKDLVMRAVFDRVGESGACLCLSNLGEMALPEEMKGYISRFDFIIGPQAKAPYNLAVSSYGGTLRLHMVRNTVEPELERRFFPFLSSLGLPISLESNQR